MAKRKKQSSRKLLIVLGVLGVVAYYFYRQTTRIIVGGASARVHKLGLSEIELRIDMSVLNQSNIAVDVQNFLGQLMYGTSALGTITQVRPVRIEPFQNGNIEFSAKLSTTSIGLEFWDELRTLLTSGSNTIDWQKFRVVGTLRAENVSIPIDQKLI